MVHNPVPASASDLPAIGLTMFGVTTPLVTQLVDALKAELRPARVPRHRHRRSVDGEAGRFGDDHRGARHDDHRGRRPRRRRRLPGRPRPLRRDRPHPRARTSARAVRSTWSTSAPSTSVPAAVRRSPVPRAQPAGDVDAHDGRTRTSSSATFIAAQAQRVRRDRCGSCCPKAVSRCSTRRASRSATPRPTRRCSPRSRAGSTRPRDRRVDPGRRTPSTTRSSRRGARRVPRDQSDARHDRAVAYRMPRTIPRHDRTARADRRRRRRAPGCRPSGRRPAGSI